MKAVTKTLLYEIQIVSNVGKGAIELGHGWPGGAYCCRREGGFPTAHHRPGSAQGLDHTVPIFATNHPTDRPVTTNFPSKRTFAHLHTQAASLLTQWRTLLFVQIWQRNVTPSLFIEHFEGIFHFEDTQVLNQRGL